MAGFNTLPTVTANLKLVLSVSVSADINTHWMAQRAGSAGTLGADMTETDTTLTMIPGAQSSGPGYVRPTIGASIVIHDEAMTVTDINGDQITVTRNVVPLAPPTPAHAAGAAIYILKYPDPWGMIADEALRPWAQQVVAGLGARSATFGAQATGSLSITGA